MRLPLVVTQGLLRCLRRIADSRQSDLAIGGREDTYLHRWFVIPRNRWFNIYLHRFQRSDDDRALHDHPWLSVSVILDGVYREIMAGGREAFRVTGDVVGRSATAAHRIEVVRTDDGEVVPVWTMFVTGPRLRSWGFHCPRGWVHWREFTSGPNGETVGRGCGEAVP